MEGLFTIMYFWVSGTREYDTVKSFFMGPDATIFQDTLIFSLMATFAVAAIYYVGLNRFYSLHKNWMWGIFLVLSGVIAFGISYSMVGTYVYPLPQPIELLGWKFIILSSFYGLLYFFLWSLLMRRWSIFASKTPF